MMPTIQLLKRQPTAKERALLWHLYEESFPFEERRPSEQIFDTPKEGLNLLLIYKAEDKPSTLGEKLSTDALLGFVTLWHLASFVFVEHFALRPEFRGQGYGSRVMEQILAEYTPLPITLECEFPSYSPEASRRIAFYRALGFEAMPITYSQPPYLEGGQAVPMLLMCNQPCTQLPIAETLYTRVYDISPEELSILLGSYSPKA